MASTPNPTAIIKPILPPNSRIAAVDPDTGALSQALNSMLTQLWSFCNGANATIPCAASSTTSNVITLQPFQISTSPGAQPGQASQLFDYTVYSFIAPIDFSGPGMVQVSGFGALNAYIQNGGAQASTGDIVTDRHYTATYVDTLNSGAGGFVIR